VLAVVVAVELGRRPVSHVRCERRPVFGALADHSRSIRSQSRSRRDVGGTGPQSLAAALQLSACCPVHRGLASEPLGRCS
jgi:hypothetical protein